MEKSYVCNRWPYLAIGSQVKFDKGLFTTDDPAVQQIVESNEAYKVQIWPQDEAPDVDEASGEPGPDEGPRVTHGMRGTGSSSSRPAKKK